MRTRRLWVSFSLSSAAAVALVAATMTGGPVIGTASAVTTTTSSTTTTTSGSTTTSSSTTSTTAPTTTTVPTTTTTVPPTTTTTLTGEQLLSATMNAFVAQRAVDWTYRLAAFGGSLDEVVHDGLKDGVMNASLTTGGAGGTVAHVSMVLDGKLYFEGNPSGLRTFESLEVAPSQKEAGKWIAVNRSSEYFAAYANNLTVASAVQELNLGGTVTALPPTTSKGQKVDVLKESLSQKGETITETVYIKSTGAPLPIAIVLSVDGVGGSIVYGPWNTPPKATVPPKSVPFKASWVASS